MKCRLTRKTSGAGSGFRAHGNPAEGTCENLPDYDSSFVMVAPSLDEEGGIRRIETTPIKELEFVNHKTYKFWTASGSEYLLEIL